MLVNSRADLENLRGTADFEVVLRGLHGAFTTWSLVGGAWVAQENLSVIECFDYDKDGFLTEIEPFDFPTPVPPDLPVEPEPTDDELWEALRAQRDARLAATDWLVQRHAEELALGLDTTLSPEHHTDLLTYRQALRDLPVNTTDPANPEWPNYEP